MFAWRWGCAIVLGVETVVQLSAAALVVERPFTAPENTERDLQVMLAMLRRECLLASTWLERAPEGLGALVRERDAEGRRHWIRVPDREALLAASEMAFVGFFGHARDDVDQKLVHTLEGGIVDTLDRVTGVLSYYDLALADGGYGNLILLGSAAAAANVHRHPLHQRAVGLTPATTTRSGSTAATCAARSWQLPISCHCAPATTRRRKIIKDQIAVIRRTPPIQRLLAIQRDPPSDLRQPQLLVAHVTQLVFIFENADEYFLSGIFGIVTISQDGVSQPEDEARMLLEAPSPSTA